MRFALSPGQGENAEGRYLRLAELPALCCQAVGGEPGWADGVTAAWLCFYQAAHLMDSLQDQDEPEEWWAEAGTGVALNAASGLFFTASLLLERLHREPGRGDLAGEIVPEFYRSFFIMCNGQHQELTCPQPSPEQYWRTAAEKSGAFFALACWAGARLATVEASRLENLREFGAHLGVLIQVKDDLEEFKPGRLPGRALQGRRMGSALPVVYAREVLPERERSRLNAALNHLAEDPHAAVIVNQLVDQSGAGLYLIAELERHRQQALEALYAARPEEQAAGHLARLVESNQGAGNYLR